MNDMENGGGRLGTLHGQRVIVMGGSSGIGLAVAHAALRAGADVTVVSSQLARIEKALEFLGSAAQGCAVDLASEAAIERYFRTSGRFDHLVYTAGDSLQLLPLAEADRRQRLWRGRSADAGGGAGAAARERGGAGIGGDGVVARNAGTGAPRHVSAGRRRAAGGTGRLGRGYRGGLSVPDEQRLRHRPDPCRRWRRGVGVIGLR